MEEPHIPTTTDETSEAEKTEQPDEARQQLSSKPMEVDDEFPTTSAGVDNVPESIFESNTHEESQCMTGNKEAGSAEETLPEVDETIEEVNFEKPTEVLDESIQNTLDYAEKSINISQIMMEHQDDSTDAFDALKRDETDVLNEIKVEINEKPESEPTPMETQELPSPIAVDDENPSPPSPIQTDEVIIEEEPVMSKSIEDTTTIAEESIEKESETIQTQTEIVDDELEKEEVGEKIDEDVEIVQSPVAPESLDLEKVTEEAEEEETETTNEGKTNSSIHSIKIHVFISRRGD